MRSSSNPVFGNLSSSASSRFQQGGLATAGYQQPGFAESGAYPGAVTNPEVAADRPMTIDDVVSKTAITLGVIVMVAIGSFAVSQSNPALAFPLMLVGGFGGLIVVLIATFGKKMDSAATTLIYAVLEGLFVGAISFALTAMVGKDAGSMIGQAVVATMAVFAGMLFVYKTGAIRVTPKFTRFMTAAIFGVLGLMLMNFVGAMFFSMNPLRDGGLLSIGFSIVCIGLAAFSFLLDFDQADKLVRAGAPSRMAWGVALGLAVTLVWLYVEILRLLSYFTSD